LESETNAKKCEMAEVCLKLVEKRERNSDNSEKQPASGAGMFWRDFYLFQLSI